MRSPKNRLRTGLATLALVALAATARADAPVSAHRVLGQLTLISNGLGFGANGFSTPAAVAIDLSSKTVNHIYVADPNYNRVLAWKDTKFRDGRPADLVIGQTS